MRWKLHNLIFVGMALGVVVGLGLWWVRKQAEGADVAPPMYYDVTVWVFDLLGPTLFMGVLKMIIAPLIFASIIAGVTSLPSISELGAIGWKTLAYYICTTTIAVVIGLIAVLTIQPGTKRASESIREKRANDLEQRRVEYQQEAGQPAVDAAGDPTAEYVVWLSASEHRRAGETGGKFATLKAAEGRKPGDIFREDILLPLLMNPFAALAANPPNALGIIFFALLFGISCTVVGSAAQPVIAFFQAMNDVMMKLTHWIMLISPVAIGAIVAHLIAESGPDVFESVGWYSATVVGGILAHVIVLLVIARVIGGVGPLALWRGLREAWTIAFTTRSSAATLPVTIANTTENLKVSPKVANFSLPLGATMNMDGTALYEGVAIIFLIQVYGGMDDVSIVMTPMTTFLIFITAVLASVGAAAVPNAGLVTMVIVASAVNLPIYYIPLIFAVDPILDMFRTSTNVLGDATGAIVVNRLEHGRLGDT
jgi:Na+/H+-dicarboxylate symporter